MNAANIHHPNMAVRAVSRTACAAVQSELCGGTMAKGSARFQRSAPGIPAGCTGRATRSGDFDFSQIASERALQDAGHGGLEARAPRFKLLMLACWIIAFAFLARGDDAAGWRHAEPGWKFEWPRDHASHPDFKTEWWYFTGNLRAADGRRFGYQITFFRQGVRAPGERAPAKSRFVVDDFKFGHFTITDVGAKEFHFSQQIRRGAFGEAGFRDGEKLAWLGGWSLTLEKDGAMQLRASEGSRSLELRLESTKPWALHGDAGLSTKADVPGHASQYYSATRMRSRGTLQIDGKSLAVEGESWFDHEWATNQLAPGQSGWDWFSVQLDDGSELMIYRLRKKDGSVDGASSGSFIAKDGSVRHLRVDEMKLTPVKFWQSAKTRGRYPIGWRVEVPPLGIELEVSTPVEAQELALDPLAYWEGMIDVRGKREGRAVNGHGYLELTGYAGDVVGLSK